jgi:hypothetical protein
MPLFACQCRQMSSMSLWDVAKEQMEFVVRQVRESSSASVLDGTDIIITARVQTQRIMTVLVGIGTRLPAHATSMGRVLLADLPPAALDDYFGRVVPEPLTRRSITSEQELRVILKTVAGRRHGGPAHLEQGLTVRRDGTSARAGGCQRLSPRDGSRAGRPHGGSILTGPCGRRRRFQEQQGDVVVELAPGVG